MVKLAQSVFFIFVLVLLTACSDKPSKSHIEKQLNSTVKKEYNNLVAIDKLKIHDIDGKDDEYVATVSFNLVINGSKKDFESAASNFTDFTMFLFAQGVMAESSEHKYKKGYMIEKLEKEKISLVKTKGEWLIDL